MSKKEIIICDQCDKKGEDYRFAIEDKSFHIDLCRQCYKSLVQPLENLGDKVGRKTVVSGSTTRAKASKRVSSGNGRTPEDRKECRAWAIQRGLMSNAKGAIPKDIWAKFDNRG